ncbi:Fe(3+)-hydroxamate ABC transporter permease FhuB [Halomonas sp. ZH2S]|uniref:Fe(3+)-hydroxamate ABC transporter permease FhuB n=1 Tax=Vreelandella zhuhanensis TaxID=2684210 RepID=A0A7X3GZZ8_9GAMM|nr:Fe(3+)-hydroxamate ABC transporter permease FhuB [Halomonas zhuhanensis]MWJ28025.1 Fe(3+)-hydroxamate ABC transporter permease FhuB [Halomonas zhuhanensis]
MTTKELKRYQPTVLTLLLAALAAGLAVSALLPVTLSEAISLIWVLETPLMPTFAVVHFSFWPRLAMALLAGAGLGLAGVLMQQVLRNPLASPTTLGVASGANLGLMAATLFVPELLFWGREWVALAGGAAAMGGVFLLAWRSDLAPAVVVLAGLVMNLYAGALGMVLLLFHQEALKGLLIWGAGSLSQNGWSDLEFLWPRLLFGALAAALLLRPLQLLTLDDASARSLGASLKALRFGGLGVAVFITACVVSVVGIIGFIGLAAPNLARLAGARRLGERVMYSMLLGGLLLASTDLALQQIPGMLPTLIPTGAATAALGAPLLLWLITRLSLTTPHVSRGLPPHVASHLGRRSAVLMGLTLLSIVIALLLGQRASGWFWAGLESIDVLQWRWPRLLAAAGSGVLLALAGTLLQRVTANPMASPEVLGISGGSAIALIGAIYALPSPSPAMLLGAGTLGALVTLGILILFNYRSGFTPSRLLLTGVAITALFDAVRAFILAGGDPRGQQVLAWLSGSTYYTTPAGAIGIAVIAALGVALTLLFSRWLAILPLGGEASTAIGLPLRHARLSLLTLVAFLTASATLVVGPLSFVGLLAPHLAKMLGFQHARAHLLGGALVGALIMTSADWFGRQWLFPQEIPAGLVASLIGGAYFMWRLARI